MPAERPVYHYAAQLLVHHGLEDGGFTLGADLSPAPRGDYWVVAVRPRMSFELPCQTAIPRTAAVAGWLATVRPTLAVDEGVGSWRTAAYAEGVDVPVFDVLVFDVVRFVPTKAAALRLARESEQEAVFHPATGRAVPVWGKPKKEAA